MKFTKASLAAILACVLALGLFACAPDEEKDLVARTPFAAVQSDPVAYLNAVIPLLGDAETFLVETTYGMDDIEVGNSTLKEARNVIKGNIISYIENSYSKERGGFFEAAEEAMLGMIKRDGAPADMEERCPALFNALEAADLTQGLAVNEVLELRVAARLETLEDDIKEGRNSSMKGKTDEEKREYVLTQLGESSVTEATGLYQLEGTLAFGAAEKLLTPADKADILAQLAKAGDYLVVESYELEPFEFTLFMQVNKAWIEKDGPEQPEQDPSLAEDMVKELKLELKSTLTATAAGAGAFEGEGEIPITLTLRKTVKYKDIKWKAADEDA